ncbi:unnamed protein product, partial [Symbiodinium necroappetens]
ESPSQRQLRLAQDGLEMAQGGLKIAQDDLKSAKDELKKAKAAKKVEAAKKKVEAAKKEVEAAKKEVEAAKKEVEAAENKVNASPAQELPAPTVDTQVKLPELQEFKANEMLDVSGFRNFVAPNTTADRPLFLRKHLLNVHTKAVEALTVEKIRLVSLVGCPGTGKTWCGWLVAYTLQKADTKTLHLTIRNTHVTAIADFTEKKQYEDVSWNGHMLKRVLRESECQVCIVDVSMDKAEQAQDIFIGVRQLIEQAREFPTVKFVGLMSGHGESKIIGKPFIEEYTKPLVLWSWTAGEVQQLCTKLKVDVLPAYAVCGGSVRFLFQPCRDQTGIQRAVRGLEQADLAKLLALDLGVDDVDKKHRTGLLSFFPRKGSNEDDESFEEGVSAAQPMPRSDFVIKCIKENKYAKFEDVLAMYTELEKLNAGAAGSTFELLVHLFWRDAAVRKDEVTLTLGKQGTVDHQHVSVNCSQFIPNPGRIEDYDAEGTVFDVPAV